MRPMYGRSGKPVDKNTALSPTYPTKVIHIIRNASASIGADVEADTYRNGFFATLNCLVELFAISCTFAGVAFVAFARPGP